MTRVTLGITESEIDELMDILKVVKCETFDVNINADNYHQKTKIMLNGNWIAFTDMAQRVVKVLKDTRMKGIIPDEVSIVRDIVQN